MKYFKNYSKEVFVNSWDNVPYRFEIGQGMYMEDYLAEHHAKHLINREMQRDGLQVDDSRRPEYLAQALASSEVRDELKNVPEEVQILNMNVKKEEIVTEIEEVVSKKVSKRGRPKKEVKEEVSQEQEFADLPTN